MTTNADVGPKQRLKAAIAKAVDKSSDCTWEKHTQDIPSRELTYPTLGKGKSSSKCHFWGDMLVPKGGTSSVISLYVKLTSYGAQQARNSGGLSAVPEGKPLKHSQGSKSGENGLIQQNDFGKKETCPMIIYPLFLPKTNLTALQKEGPK